MKTMLSTGDLILLRHALFAYKGRAKRQKALYGDLERLLDKLALLYPDDATPAPERRP
jgi:hypothetical protein